MDLLKLLAVVLFLPVEIQCNFVAFKWHASVIMVMERVTVWVLLMKTITKPVLRTEILKHWWWELSSCGIFKVCFQKEGKVRVVGKLFKKSQMWLLVWHRFWFCNQFSRPHIATMIPVSVHFARHRNVCTLMVFESTCLSRAFIRLQSCSSAWKLQGHLVLATPVPPKVLFDTVYSKQWVWFVPPCVFCERKGW